MLLNLSLTNSSSRKSIWVAFSSSGMSGNRRGIIKDSSGFEFLMDSGGSSGIASATVVKDVQFYASAAPAAPDHFNQATEIQPGDSVSATANILFRKSEGLRPQASVNVQLEILVSNDFNNGTGSCTAKNLSTKISAE